MRIVSRTGSFLCIKIHFCEYYTFRGLIIKGLYGSINSAVYKNTVIKVLYYIRRSL